MRAVTYPSFGPRPLQLAVRPAPGPLRLGARLQALHDGGWWAATVVGMAGPPPAVAAVAGAAGAPMEGAPCARGLVGICSLRCVWR